MIFIKETNYNIRSHQDYLDKKKSNDDGGSIE
jgi:hypothetical protein